MLSHMRLDSVEILKITHMAELIDLVMADGLNGQSLDRKSVV